jgi:hypothetical protein
MVASRQFRSICSDRSDELSDIRLAVLFLPRFLCVTSIAMTAGRFSSRALPPPPGPPTPAVSIVCGAWVRAWMSTILAYRRIELSGGLRSRDGKKGAV